MMGSKHCKYLFSEIAMCWKNNEVFHNYSLDANSLACRIDEVTL